ncbi:MAG: divalent metal cation transporter [Thermoguttaceae bacterium]|jgi:Mn2+/Fe2+ NRAMP family transporter|nr:divalent metal cation transporter [Thermoguttaceae bacterium]
MASDVKQQQSVSQNPKIERDRQLIVDARAKGRGPLLGAFVRLSGPGWLQSAITLGGGSLSSSLYLGVLGGFMFMWLQPVAMIAGIVMLSAIAYVTLSTGKRPLRAINEHINPVLGWGWLLASMTANLVWSMPQFALATAAFRQNLLPGVFGPEAMPETAGKVCVSLIILAVALTASMLYTTGGKGMKAFEIVVKCMVGTTVLCFIGVVTRLTMTGELPWNEILGGFVPNLRLLSEPTHHLMPLIDQVAAEYRDFWKDIIVGQQRDVMISAAATAVGINMTFLFPYSMLRKGWDRDFRGLAIFDLSTGLFFPFLLATSCVVIASASQFHAQPGIGLMGEQDEVTGQPIVPAANLVGSYNGLLRDRLQAELGAETMDTLSKEEITARIETLDDADRRMAAVLARRDAFNLSDALSPLVGRQFSHYVFGLGVLGMAMGAATMLMLINGLCFCELLNRPAMGWTQRIGSAMVCVGILGPFFWTDAQMWLAIPTSVFAMTLLPFAYFSFYLLMNQKTLLGNDMPRGLKRLWWNTLMAIAAGLAAFASLWSLWSKLQWIGIGLVGLLLVLMAVVHLVRKANRAA